MSGNLLYFFVLFMNNFRKIDKYLKKMSVLRGLKTHLFKVIDTVLLPENMSNDDLNYYRIEYRKKFQNGGQWDDPRSFPIYENIDQLFEDVFGSSIFVKKTYLPISHYRAQLK